MEATKCPNCTASFNPRNRQCEYCGSYIIFTNKKIETYGVHNNQKIYFNNILLEDGEYPVRSGVANMYYSLTQSDGGQLLLTNRRLIFSAHSLNLNPNKYWEIDINVVREVVIAKNLLITQILSVQIDNEEFKFVVYKGKEWLKDILQVVA